MEINLKINQRKKKWWVMKTNLNIILNLLWLISDNLSWLEVKCELQSCCYQRGNDTSIQIDIWCKVENIDARGCHPEDPPLFWSPMAHLGDPFQAVLVHVQKKMERSQEKKKKKLRGYHLLSSNISRSVLDSWEIRVDINDIFEMISYRSPVSRWIETVSSSCD